MIGNLQSLRFIFAIFIFLHHRSIFELGGTCGVSFFLILSGFVMMMGYEDKVKSQDFHYFNYLKKRVVRVYPLHIICLFIFLVLNWDSIDARSIKTLLPNLLLLQSWIPIKDYYFSGNALSWCLSNLLFFYALFPYIVRYYQYRTKKQIFITSTCILSAYILVLLSLPSEYSHAVFYINPLFRLPDFMIGMGLYKAYTYIHTYIQYA